MIAIAISVLFAGALFAGLAPRWSPGARALAVPQISIAFVGLYLAVSDQVAQDRAEYYRWYRASAALLVDPDARDRGFTLLLNALPDRLSSDAFGFVLAAMMITLICGFLVTLARRNLIHWVGVPIALVFAVCDRLFLDITLNSSRSSLAALVFLFGAIQRKSGWRWALWALVGRHFFRKSTRIIEDRPRSGRRRNAVSAPDRFVPAAGRRSARFLSERI
jgi:GNAT superfamily N-acetyltransferase